MEKYREIEKSIIKKFRPTIWSKFIKAIKDYELISDGDKIAVCVSGGKDSFLMAKCFEELKKHQQVQFEVVYILMDPGYSQITMAKIKNNAQLLNLDLTIFESQIFKVASQESPENPCYLCARMRRGTLYNYAQELGCNKIALAHHFNDVIETTLLNLLYAGQISTMKAKVNSQNFANMQLIRPFYYVKEENILSWVNYHQLSFINCSCPLSDGLKTGKRKEIKHLINDLSKVYKDIPQNIFTALNTVNFAEND